MSHNNDGRPLRRATEHKQALMRNMATSLFRRGRIKTTEAKAKGLPRLSDKCVVLTSSAH
jgi:large subunit ribosomal protein L17